MTAWGLPVGSRIADRHWSSVPFANLDTHDCQATVNCATGSRVFDQSGVVTWAYRMVPSPNRIRRVLDSGTCHRVSLHRPGRCPTGSLATSVAEAIDFLVNDDIDGAYPGDLAIAHHTTGADELVVPRMPHRRTERQFSIEIARYP